jgi:hypothetical protein
MPGQALVYSDTRGFYYPGELLMDSYHLPAAAADWPQRLLRVLEHGTQYFLLRTDSNLWKLLEPHSPDVLHRDEQFVILSADAVRKSAALAIRGETNGTLAELARESGKSD